MTNTQATPLDFGDDAKPQVTESGFKELDQMIMDLRTAEDEVAKAQDALKAAQAKQQRLSEQSIPAKMEEMGLEDFTTTLGLKVSIKKSLRHSISKERKPEALQWLRANGHADIIKTSVSVQFGVGEEDQASELFRQQLKDFGPRASRDEDVNAATVKALLTKLLRDGVDIPMSTFACFEQKSTVIKDPKQKK